MLTGLVPGAAYRVHFSRGIVDVRLGKGRKADETGALSFKTGAPAKRKEKRPTGKRNPTGRKAHGKKKGHGKAHKGAHKPSKHG